MTAWDLILLESSAPANSTAWQHLVSVQSNSGTTYPVYFRQTSVDVSSVNHEIHTTSHSHTINYIKPNNSLTVGTNNIEVNISNEAYTISRGYASGVVCP